MGKYANFYDGVRELLDKIADALDPGTADTKTANYQTAVLNSLERIGDKVGDVASATLPDASTATDGDTLVVDDGEWTIGSGSELPIASASNEGQALVSTKKYVKGAVIIPQQTVTLDGYNEVKLSNTNDNLFTVGTTCIAVVDGVEWQGIIVDTGGEPPFLNLDNQNIQFFINDLDEFWYYNENSQEGDESTIALYVAEPAYSWEPDPYPGYDIVIRTSVSLQSATSSDLSIMKGSFDSCMKRTLNNLPITPLVYQFTVGHDNYHSVSILPIIGIETYVNYGDEVNIRVCIAQFPAASISSTTYHGVASNQGIRNIHITESGISITNG